MGVSSMGVTCYTGVSYQYGSDLLLWVCLVNICMPCYYGCVLSIWVCLVTMGVSYMGVTCYYGCVLSIWE